MKIYDKKQIPISSIVKYENNARIHSQTQLEQIIDSIKTFGFVNPLIVDEKNNLIAGHGRLEAVEIINMRGGIDDKPIEEIPAIVVTGLSDAERRALIIADNKIAENSSWDYDKLASELESLQQELENFSVLGFDDNEIKEIYAEVDEKTPTINVENDEILFANLIYKKYKVPMSIDEADHLIELLENFKKAKSTLAGFVKEYFKDAKPL